MVGDVAASLAWNGEPVPGLRGGSRAAFMSRTSSADVSRVGQPRNRSGTITRAVRDIGRQAAVADFHGLKVRGAVAWWLWGAAHILFLVGGRKRVGRASRVDVGLSDLQARIASYHRPVHE